MKKLKTQVGLVEPRYNFDGSGIMRGCSSTNLTGDRIRKRVKDHEQNKVELAAKKTKNVQKRQKKELSKLLNLRPTLKKAVGYVIKIYDEADENEAHAIQQIRLDKCKCLVTQGLEYATHCNDEQLFEDITLAQQKKGKELKTAIVRLCLKYHDKLLKTIIKISLFFFFFFFCSRFFFVPKT